MSKQDKDVGRPGADAPSGFRASHGAGQAVSTANAASIPNAVLQLLDGILQRGLPLTKDEAEAVAYARYAVLRERDRFVPEAKSWDGGNFLLYRRAGHGEGRGLSRFAGGQKMPRFRHKTREAADHEATRLLSLFPQSTFIVLQEVGRMKLKPASGIEAPSGGETRSGSTEGESPAPEGGDAQ